MRHYFSGNDYSTDYTMHARLFSYWYVRNRPLKFGQPVFKDPAAMKTYMAGFLSFLGRDDGSSEEVQITRSAAPTGILETFFYISQAAQQQVTGGKNWSTMLDSGAFSAFTQNKSVDLQEYIAYVLQHRDVWDIIASLDVIGDAEASWNNAETMWKAGIEAIPAFHYGEPWEFLDRMVSASPYIAIGGVAQLGGGDALTEWLDLVWSNHLTLPDGTPKVQVHGYAITGKAMLLYPWASVDSSSWLQMAGRGVVAIDLPQADGGWTDVKISFSDRSPAQDVLDKHFDTLPGGHQKRIGEYLERLGYNLDDLRQSYRWRQHCNIGYYKRMETRGVSSFHRAQPGLFI